MHPKHLSNAAQSVSNPIMKKIFLLIALLITQFSFAQKADSWWSVGTYFKFPILEKGIYRLSVSDLDKIWTSKPADFKSANLHLYRQGQRVAVLTAADYIEFYGEGNNGVADSSMYLPVSAQPHQYTSLFSDTAYYYLRYDPNLAPKSISTPTVAAANLPTAAFHFEHQLKLFNNEWTFSPRSGPLPTLESPYFEEGETFTSPMIQKDSLALQTIAMPDFDEKAGFQPKISLQINGRDNFDHRIFIRLGKDKTSLQLQDSLLFNGFKAKNRLYEVPKTAIVDAKFIISSQSKNTNAFDRYSFNYYEVIYPQAIRLAEKRYYLNTAAATKLAFEKSTDDFAAYSLTNVNAPLKLSFQANELGIPAEANNHEIFVGKIKTIKALEAVVFKSFDKISANYVVITHPLFNVAAQKFADYRASSQGGSYDAAVFNIRELYDQFNFGIRGPLAIRNFAQKLEKTDAKDRLFLLVGRARSIYDNKSIASPESQDPMPAFGFPGSDNLLTAGLNGASPFLPRYPVGRINTLSNAEALDYFDKVLTNEAATETLWRKKVLHLSGGRSSFELQNFKNILDAFKPAITAGAMGGQVESITKKTIDPVEKIDISSQVNAGIGMLTFFGHSNPSGADIDMGQASDPARGFQNTGKYPIVFFNGCGLGNIYFGGVPLSTNWLLTPKKGAVLVLSHTYSGYVSPLSVFMNQFYETISDEKFVNKPFGYIQQEVLKKYLAQYNKDDYNIVNAMLMNIQGDPAVKLFPTDKPDYQIDTKKIFLQSGSFKSIVKSDSIQVGLIVENAGRYLKDGRLKFSVALVAAGKTETYQRDVPAVAFRDTLFVGVKKPVDAAFQVQVKLDLTNQISEMSEANNNAEIGFSNDVLKELTLFPESIIPDKIRPLMVVGIDENVRSEERRVGKEC